MSKQTCPRRMRELGPWKHDEGADTWKSGTSFVTAKRDYEGVKIRSCSFCGSIHPDDFMTLVIDHGYVVGPTDKNYKVYLAQPVSEAERARQKEEWFAGAEAKHLLQSTREHHPEIDEQMLDRLLNKHWREVVSLLKQGSDIGKFYTVHLSPEQGDQFWSAYTANKIRMGYPGYFYRPIFLPGVYIAS
jgi:hypothetical protein